MKKYTDDLSLDYVKLSQLSYEDLDCEDVQLFLDGTSVGLVEVCTDWENEKREYIVINNEIIYLDTIKTKHYFCLN